MMFLLSLHSDQDAGIGIECGHVEVTSELAALILRRAARFKRHKSEDSDLLESYYWSGDCLYLSSDVTGDPDLFSQEVQDFMDKGTDFQETDWRPGHQVLADMECLQMIIDEEKVRWIAAPAHQYGYVTTAGIPLNKIEELLGRGV
jgi:hypothetical protein